MYAILAAFLIILILILILPFKARLCFAEKKATLLLYISGLTVYKKVFGKKREEKAAESDSPLKRTAEIEKDTVSIGKRIKRFKDLFSDTTKLLRKYVSLDFFELKIDIGTGDAATTAIAAGTLWGAIYGLLGALGTLIYVEKHNVQINPVYTNSSFNLEGECIFKSRIVHIIIIVITILIKKYSREGKEVNNERASY